MTAGIIWESIHLYRSRVSFYFQKTTTFFFYFFFNEMAEQFQKQLWTVVIFPFFPCITIGPNDNCQLLHMSTDQSRDLISNGSMPQEVSVICLKALSIVPLPCWHLVRPQHAHDCLLTMPRTQNCSATYIYFLSSITIQALQTLVNHTDCERLQMFQTNGSHPNSLP